MSAIYGSGDSHSSGRRTFDFGAVFIADYSRKGEMRRIAVGYLDGRLHLLCYIPRADGIRFIGFRKTNKREARALWQTANH